MFPIKQAHPLVAEGDDLSNYTLQILYHEM